MISTYLIKKYKQFNESNSFKDTKEIIETIKDICLELEDDGLEYSIFPNDDIRIKILGLKLSELTSLPIEFYVEINIEDSVINTTQIGKLSKEQKNTIVKTFQHLENFATSLGLDFYYWYKNTCFRTTKTKCKVSGKIVNRQPGEAIDYDYNFRDNITKLRFYFNI